jgi:SpoIID/LytB domain protein
MTVELTALTGRDTIVTGLGLAINRVPAGAAALVRRTAAGTFQVYTGPGCAGPWTPKAGLLGSGLSITTSGSQTILANLVRVCETAGERAYRGSLTVVNSGAAQRTINHVPTESYLRGVVPRESPASWGSLAGGRGMQALRAQAVAARSYALASNRIVNVARTCDTTACQVYRGAAFKTGASLASLEHPLTDTAISGTAGVVRLKGGVVARTEFSSSTGGYTAGGAFTAVADAGDSVASNPNHSWTTTVTLSAVGSKLRTGAIRSITVTARNGLGADGGRVRSVRVVSTAGVVRDFTGEQVRTALGLKSDWFSISSYTPAEAQAVVKALYQDLLGRPADPSGLATWTAMLGRGVSQSVLVATLTRSNEYVQLRIRRAYLQVLNRAPDAGGLAAWTREILAGRIKVDDVERRLYSTQEFVIKSGSTNARYAAKLYTTILGRPASPAEVTSTANALRLSGRSKVVDRIWFSTEAARHRAGSYYLLFLKRAADPGGLTTWARVLLAQGEGAVRTGLAGSGEYRVLSLRRFP